MLYGALGWRVMRLLLILRLSELAGVVQVGGFVGCWGLFEEGLEDGRWR